MNRSKGRRLARVMLPYFAAVHGKDVLHLYYLLGCLRDQVLWVSVCNNVWNRLTGNYVVQWMLPCFVAAHWQDVSAPWSPIRLSVKSNVVSVCVKWWMRSSIGKPSGVRDFTVFFCQRIGKLFCTLITNFVPSQVKCCECLWKTRDE